MYVSVEKRSDKTSQMSDAVRMRKPRLERRRGLGRSAIADRLARILDAYARRDEPRQRPTTVRRKHERLRLCCSPWRPRVVVVRGVAPQ